MNTQERAAAIEELIETCNNLCKKLGDMAAAEQEFCQQLCEGFDIMSWEAYKMKNDIQFIYDRYGVC